MSLRLRLTALSAVVGGVVLLATSLFLLHRLEAGLVQSVDALATARARDVAVLVAAGRLDDVASLPVTREVVVQVVGKHGDVLATSPNATGRGRLFRFPPGPPARTVSQVVLRADTVDYRVVAARVGDTVVYVGSPVDDVQDGVRALTTGLALGGPVLLGLLVAGVWLVVGRALQPVEILRRQAASVSPADLSGRVDVPRAPELGRLAATLNDLLAAVQESSVRQRRFIGDAAHEFRTPVAGMLASLELHERTCPDPETAHLAQQARRLSSLVSDLLTLARLDGGDRPRAATLDLALLVRHVLDERPDVPSALYEVWACVDPIALQRVVVNLLDNADSHGHGCAEVTVEPDHDHALLVVRDRGPGIPSSERERIFHPFLRLDDVRSRDEGGVGLGLALVREAVAAAGGTIHVEDAGPGARFVVRLPRAVPRR